jgi:hypothetical protein
VQSVAQEVASKVDSWVEDRERELTQLSNLISASGANSAQTAIDLIVRATTNDPFDEMQLVDVNGNPVASTGAAGAVSLVGQSWVTGIAQSSQPYVGDVTLNAAGNDLQWLLAVPASTSQPRVLRPPRRRRGPGALDGARRWQPPARRPLLRRHRVGRRFDVGQGRRQLREAALRDLDGEPRQPYLDRDARPRCPEHSHRQRRSP